MNTIKVLLVLLVIFFLRAGSSYLSHQFRQNAQENESLYTAMLNIDAFSFVTAGGGAVGYDNYYKWRYSHWINSPERSWLERILFWDQGIFYDATAPPEHYRYPTLFEDS